MIEILKLNINVLLSTGRRVPEAICSVRTSEGVWGYSPCMGTGEKPCGTNGFRAFQRAKMSPQDMQLNTISYIFLQKIKLNTHRLKGLSKRRPKLVVKTDYRLMQVRSIAECSKGSILQCIRPSLNYNLSLRSFLSFFEWPLKTGFTVTKNLYMLRQVVCTCVFAYT